MFNVYLKEYEKLEKILNEIYLEFDDVLLESKKSIDECQKSIKLVKKHFKTNPMPSKKEEITFFKTIKPLFVAKLIYHLEVFNMESNLPNGSNEIRLRYYQNQLKKLKHFFDENRAFYRYHRTQSTFLDHKYFTRGQYDIHLNLNAYVFEFDYGFSTSHDYIVARILANDLIQIYVEEQLDGLKLTENRSSSFRTDSRLKWTGSKIALIELIYALQSSNCINHGKVDIKYIANVTEQLFGINLGDYYRAFLEIRMRKKGRTKFLDFLIEKLEKRMDETDD